MRLLPFAESASIVERRQWARRAMYADWLPPDLVDALWAQPQSLVERGEVLQRRGVRQTVRLTWGANSFVLKRYVEPSWRHAAKQLVMPSRARVTWNISHLLADGGVLTPRPVACIENTWGLLGLDSYLMYPYVAGETIRQFLHMQWQPHQAASELLEKCQALWQRLEALSASLADANVGNFIVTADRQLWVIDLDKAQTFRRARSAHRRRQRAWRQLTGGVQRALDALPAHDTLPIRRAA